MFTGLVEATGAVRSVSPGPGGAGGLRLSITTALTSELARGDSIAVNGVCLSATGLEGEAFDADVVAETARRSSLGALAPGEAVNLELPLRPGDRLGGHIVQGHVDGIGEIQSVDEEGGSRTVRIAAPPELLRYVVEKGSIAVDGVSLTVAAVGEESFEIAVIPETLARTTLGAAAAGRAVNLEVDVLAKHVEKLLPALARMGA